MVVCGGLYFFFIWGSLKGGHERTDVLPFATLGVWGGHERTDFLPFAMLAVCAGLKRTDF